MPSYMNLHTVYVKTRPINISLFDVSMRQHMQSNAMESLMFCSRKRQDTVSISIHTHTYMHITREEAGGPPTAPLKERWLLVHAQYILIIVLVRKREDRWRWRALLCVFPCFVHLPSLLVRTKYLIYLKKRNEVRVCARSSWCHM